MRVVDAWITDPNIKPKRTIPPGYTLEERRPDLFDLKLTPENTRTRSSCRCSRKCSTRSSRSASPVRAHSNDWPARGTRSMCRSSISSRAFARRSKAPERTLAHSYAVVLPPAPKPENVQPLDVARETLGLTVETLDIVSTPRFDAPSLSRAYGYDDILERMPVAGAGTLSWQKTSAA